MRGLLPRVKYSREGSPAETPFPRPTHIAAPYQMTFIPAIILCSFLSHWCFFNSTLLFHDPFREMVLQLSLCGGTWDQRTVSPSRSLKHNVFVTMKYLVTNWCTFYSWPCHGSTVQAWFQHISAEPSSLHDFCLRVPFAEQVNVGPIVYWTLGLMYGGPSCLRTSLKLGNCRQQKVNLFCSKIRETFGVNHEGISYQSLVIHGSGTCLR